MLRPIDANSSPDGKRNPQA